jgi:hypothetical protein
MNLNLDEHVYLNKLAALEILLNTDQTLFPGTLKRKRDFKKEAGEAAS